MNNYLDYKVFTDYSIFDADQHLSERTDCYTRNIDARYRDRTLRIEPRQRDL